MWIFLAFFIFGKINCYDPISRLSLKDQCIKLCRVEELPVLHSYSRDNVENIICRTGCRLFDIQFGGGLDVNPAIKRCQIGCDKTFVSKSETNICYIGCDRIASKLQNQIQRALIMSPQEKYRNDLVLGEPETDLVETDLLSDPSIKSQLEIGFNIDYKIPETRIRTMPIEGQNQPVVQIKPKATSGDWLDCASKNSGIPRWILLSTMLGAIMVAIWLTLSMDSRKSHEEFDDELLVDDKKHNKENFIIGKDGCDKIDVEFLPPPKYSEVNEVDDSEPPNYSEAVQK